MEGFIALSHFLSLGRWTSGPLWVFKILISLKVTGIKVCTVTRLLSLFLSLSLDLIFLFSSRDVWTTKGCIMFAGAVFFFSGLKPINVYTTFFPFEIYGCQTIFGLFFMKAIH